MQEAIPLEGTPKITGAKIGIIFSKWYPDLVQNMVTVCEQILTNLGASTIEKHQLPGSLELPCAAKYLLQQDDSFDALIAFGVILKGETYHFEMISNECSRGLADVSLQFTIPILCEVLSVTSIDQAKARSANDKFNKGIEAAVAAAEMIAWQRELKKRASKNLGFK